MHLPTANKMYKRLLIILSAILIVGCHQNQDGLEFKVKGNQVCWKNRYLEFRLDMDSKGKKTDSQAIQAGIRDSKGKTRFLTVDPEGLGFGGSSPMGLSGLYKPDKGVAQAELLDRTQDKLVLHLRYDPWDILDEPVSLDKQITIYRDSPVMDVIDMYTGDYELLNIAAALAILPDSRITPIENGFSIDYSDGITAVIIMPGADQKSSDTGNQVILKKSVATRKTLRYLVGISDKGKEFLIEELTKIL